MIMTYPSSCEKLDEAMDSCRMVAATFSEETRKKYHPLERTRRVALDVPPTDTQLCPLPQLDSCFCDMLHHSIYAFESRGNACHCQYSMLRIVLLTRNAIMDPAIDQASCPRPEIRYLTIQTEQIENARTTHFHLPTSSHGARPLP